MPAHYGNIGIADRLKRARIAAGYGAMRDASEAFGWPPGTYSGHETGARRISEEDLADYAKAFACPLEWLRSGHAPARGRWARFARIGSMPTEDLRAEFLDKRTVPTPTPEIDVGRRLVLACAVAGKGSVSGTATQIGLRRSALGNYAGGRSKLPGLMSAIYGLALGVSSLWLRTGRPPSGLQLPDGMNEEEAISAIAEGRELPVEQPVEPVSARRRVAAILDAAERRRLATRSVDKGLAIRIPEFRPAGEDAPTPAEWEMPRALFSHVPEERHPTFAIVTIEAILGKAPRMQVGDRVVVEIGRQGEGGDVHVGLAADGRFIVAAPDATDTIGTIVLYLGGEL